MTPDISAETCEGAAGCAPGSQMWNGMMPAFAPKPMSAKINTAFFRDWGAADMPFPIAAKSNEPVAPYRSRNAKMINAVPICVMMK